jgi:hypothetical protein
MDETLKNPGLKKMRVLTIALIFSGALNIGLVATGIFTQCQDESSPLFIRQVAKNKAQNETSVERYIAQMDTLSFHALVSSLTNRDPVDEGYLKRDLALSALVAFHHFNVEKALSGSSLQRRTVSLREGAKVDVFPGLSNEHFEAIIRFAYEEKWPLTAEGLFKLFRKWPEVKDETLVKAFLVTPEFHALNVLFQKTNASQPAVSLLNLVFEGSWDLLDQFAKQQAQLLDLSEEKRRCVLLNYLAIGSKSAAQLLLSTDFAFIAKRLEDKGIVGMLSLLDAKSPDTERLCLELLRSPRSDAVWSSAASLLYAKAGESVASPLDLQEARNRFIPTSPPSKQVAIVAEPDVILTPKTRQHIVKEGESLWKIARHYNVKMDDLVKANEMEKDRLFPGMVLRIP